MLEFFHHLTAGKKREVLSGAGQRDFRCPDRNRRKIHNYPQIRHIIFEIFQLIVHLAVTVFFGLIHIVQLIKDYFERLFQIIEVDDFGASFASAALNAEIRIDKQKGLHRKIVKFQVPG